ncbi:MAG: hypothetical protein HUU25_10940 [Candidatus Sumerlaeia bacterium]|nr:hypothetical protein [Candidatus Sumerlaeia bacterium]
MGDKPADFLLISLRDTLARLHERGVPHAGRLLDMIATNPELRWSELDAGDRAIVQGWSLHLVGMLNRLHSQLQRVSDVVQQASRIERANPRLSSGDLLRLGEHHSQAGRPDKANAFRLAAALRTPAINTAR